MRSAKKIAVISAVMLVLVTAAPLVSVSALVDPAWAVVAAVVFALLLGLCALVRAFGFARQRLGL